MSNQEKRINQGYEIFVSCKVGNVEYVIGHNPKALSPYVVWNYKSDKGYYWGFYTNTEQKAMNKLISRVRMGDIGSLKGRGIIPSDKGGRDVR